MDDETHIIAYAPGTKVLLHGAIEATVTGITIRQCGVAAYEIAWISSGKRIEEWVKPCELAAFTTDRVKIGFLSLQQTPIK